MTRSVSFRICILSILTLPGLIACNDAPPTDDQAATGSGQTGQVSQSEPAAESAAAFDAATYINHIKTLASDEFGGRAPASPGETKTITYLQQEFEKLGVKPGNGNSYFQDVPLVTMTATPQPLIIHHDDHTRELAIGPDAVIWSKRVTEAVELKNSELVFVGYGIVAPEYGWNDYDGIDMRGKTAVILVNDPGYATQDPDLFKGNTMTYYGRWTYKFEEAARQGAAGALVIHETAPAAYGWEVVEGSWTGAQHDLVTANKNMDRAAIEGWISNPQADGLLKAVGTDYESAKQQAMRKGFKPFPMTGLTASTSVTNQISVSDSKNVVGIIPGSERPDEVVLFMGHWDHLGTDTSLEGDQIFNGAIDNATGTAGLLMLAEAFANAPQAPERSIMFVAVTAEESGLLGSKHYGENPIYPLAKTVAGINMDALSVYGRTKDVAVVGFGSSELEDYLAAEAAKQDRVIVQEASPEKGYFYRSDHLHLAKAGVPMLYAKSGQDLREGGVAAGKQADDDYRVNRYHRPADEYDASWWKVDGALEDLQLFFGIANRIANEDRWVQWYDGTEFKAIREASLAEQ